MGYCSAIFKKGLKHTATWMNPEHVRLWETNQTQRQSVVLCHLFVMSRIGKSAEMANR